MKILTVSAISVLCTAALLLLILHIKTLKPLRSVLLHALIGLGSLAILNMLSGYTGIKIPINAYSLSAAGVLGIPGVCGFLILNILL